MSATVTPPPPISPAPTPASSSTPPPPPSASTVWASLILDLGALAAIVACAKWHVFPSEVTAAAFFSVITGRVVAKASRGGGPPGSGGVASIGGVAAVATSLYSLLYHHKGGA